MNDFVRRGRTFGACELNVKYVWHFGDERQPAGQFPADFLGLFPKTLRLSLLRNVVHGTRVLHGFCTGGARSRHSGKLTRKPHKRTRSHMHNLNARWCVITIANELRKRNTHATPWKQKTTQTTDRRQTRKTNSRGPTANDCRQPVIYAHDYRNRRRRCSAAPFNSSSETGPLHSLGARILIIFFVFES